MKLTEEPTLVLMKTKTTRLTYDWSVRGRIPLRFWNSHTSPPKPKWWVWDMISLHIRIFVSFFLKNPQIIHPTPGEKCSGAYGIWRQLNTLHHLVTGLNSMEIVWFPQDSNINLQDEIDKLISAFTQNETDQLKGKYWDASYWKNWSYSSIPSFRKDERRWTLHK